MKYKIDNVQIMYDGKPLPDPATIEMDVPEHLMEDVKQWEQSITIPITGTVTNEGRELLDRMHWDMWEKNTFEVIDGVDPIRASAQLLAMLRYAIDIKPSEYGMNAIDRMLKLLMDKWGNRDQ